MSRDMSSSSQDGNQISLSAHSGAMINAATCLQNLHSNDASTEE